MTSICAGRGRNKNPNKKAIAELPVFLSAANLKPFIGKDLIRSSTPMKFRLSEGSGGLGGNVALGYRAELLPQVCNVYLQAKYAGKLTPNQEHIAEQCLMLLNGFATVGIIALVDEATGYQYDRPRKASRRGKGVFGLGHRRGSKASRLGGLVSSRLAVQIRHPST